MVLKRDSKVFFQLYLYKARASIYFSFSWLFLGACRLMIFLLFCVFFTVTSFRRCTVTAQKSCTFPLFSWCDFRCIFSMWFFNVFPQYVVDVILRLSLFFSFSLTLCVYVCPITRCFSCISQFIHVYALWNLSFLRQFAIFLRVSLTRAS